MQVKDGRSGEGGGITRTTPLTCERLRGWVQLAQPGARLTYHNGANAAEAPRAIRDLVNDLAEKGYVTPHLIRIGGQPIRIVQRTTREMLKGARL